MILVDTDEPRTIDENGKELPDWLTFERYADDDYNPLSGQGSTYDWWRLSMPGGNEAVIAEYSTPFSYPRHRYDVCLDDVRTQDQVAFDSLSAAVKYATALHSGLITRDMLALNGRSDEGLLWTWPDIWKATDGIEAYAAKVAQEYLGGKHEGVRPMDVVQDDFDHGRIVMFNNTYVPTGLEDSHIGAPEARKAAAEYIWHVFGDYPAIDEEECIEEDFLGFDAGTHREEIWLAIEDELKVPVHTLMFPETAEKDELGEEDTEVAPFADRMTDHMRFRLASDFFNGERMSGSERNIDDVKEH